LLVAGPPDSSRPRDALESLEGRQEGVLRVHSTVDGRTLAEEKLDSPPVYVGWAVAGGRLYWSAMDGRVRCWGGDAERAAFDK
jgi:hypothetical protein